MLPAANALVVTVGTRRSRPCRPSDPWRPRRADRYERRRPEQTPLHRVISRHLETWLAARSLGERPVPTHVEGELREYLRCGILCCGFARARCTGCGHGFLVASRLSRVRQPWEPLAFPSAAPQDGAMDGPPCLWLAARAGASVRPARAAAWPNRPRTLPTVSSRRCPSGSG